MRAERYYKPFFLTLKDFSHDLYLGTSIPKNFSSRVEINKPSTGEKRETLIYMNNPLRYGGETFYQASWLPNDSGTVLQVVRNPTWLTPYLACFIVALGLIIQFLSHLVGFAEKRTA
jgi:cytochrome c biogenesis protein ResB